MKLTIINNFGKFDNDTWVKDSDKLEIPIIHTYSRMLELYAIINGNTQKVVNNKITITHFASDEINIKIKVVLNGKVLKNVSCETLKVVRLDTEPTIVPEIHELTLKVKEIEDSFTEQIKILKEQNELLKVENEKLKQFIQNDIGEEENE